MNETYISVDIETDGPIPGPHSMLSLGAAAFALGDAPRREVAMLGTFSRNLETLPGATMHPVTKAEFWDKNPDAWTACRADPRAPKEAMNEFVAWVRATAGQRKPVFVAYPAGFDFLFVYWYLMAFAGESPFGFSALDIKSYAAAVLKTPYRETAKRTMPTRWFPASRHTHVALDDAIEQGELWMNILREHLGSSS
jgi:hypothetical protein